jgi:hypothetical protein
VPLEFDPETSEISYEGKVVGHYTFEDGVPRVSLNITYECGPEDQWMVPLSWFAYGLAMLHGYKEPLQQNVAAITVETAQEEIAEEFAVSRYLTEVTVKRDGYVWRFHKTDPDDWPSKLHGHDYEKHLKMDALTGDIYDVGTRHRCKTLRKKELSRIQDVLKASDDFTGKLTEFGLI